MNKDIKIYIAGHKGMVGSAIQRQLEAAGYNNIISRTRNDLDLLNQNDVADFFASEKPDMVYLAAAKVGGIHGNNTYPAKFIYENLSIQNNIIHSAYVKMVVVNSYSSDLHAFTQKMATQPMIEAELTRKSGTHQ